MKDLGDGLESVVNPEEETPISEFFHENTKLHPKTGYLIAPKDDFTLPELKRMASGYKKYPYARKIKLPEKATWPECTQGFDEVIENRRSVRNFIAEPLSMEELSKLLYQTFGITGELSFSGGNRQPLRTVPSGGALYPAEIYVGIRNVTGLEPGIYHYQVATHGLEEIRSGDPTDGIHEALCGQEYCKTASVIFLITGFLARTKFKYGERGYRYVLLDIGHLGQNLYLSCTGMNLAIMTTCGYFDDVANKLLKIDGQNETMMYAAFVGKKGAQPE